MRFLVIASLAGLGLAVTLPDPTPARPQSEAAQVKAVLLTQVRLFKAGRFRQEYLTTYTPNFRAHCPWSRYLARQRYGRRVAGTRFTVQGIRARFLSPTLAMLAYRFVRPDGSVAAVVTFRERDLYAKVGGRWLDEWGSARDC